MPIGVFDGIRKPCKNRLWKILNPLIAKLITMKIPKLGLLILPLILLTGCWRIGPDKLALDRFSYTATIGDSWKDEMLLNLVKIRYGDVPVFLGVQSVIAQYTLSGALNLNGGWNERIAPPTWSASIGGAATYQDRPTITFSPLTGKKFGESMITPIPPSALVALLQAGYPASMILRLSVHSINGLQNYFNFQAKGTPPDAAFYRLLDLIGELQGANVLGMHVRTQGKETAVLLSIREPRNEELRGKVHEFRSLLHLDPEIPEFSVVYEAVPTSKNEIAILTRSVFDVLTDLSGYIEVPPQHLKDQRAFPSKPATSVAGRPLPPLVKIHSGSGKSDDAFVAVPYHDQWFWLDDRDIESKMTFSFLMFIFTLVESHEGPPSPSIVVPTG